MSIYDTFGTDSVKEQQGVAVPYPPNKDGSIPTFYIARAHKGNKDWQKAFDRATQPFKQAIRLKTMSPAQWDHVGKEVFLEAILKGWQNVQGKDGNDIPYSKEAAKKLIADLPNLYYDLDERSTDMELFKNIELEEDAGNSETSSSTS